MDTWFWVVSLAVNKLEKIFLGFSSLGAGHYYLVNKINLKDGFVVMEVRI